MNNCKKGAIIAGLVGAVIGLVGFGVFNSVIHWAGSTGFCGTFCHSMDYAYAAYHQGQHAKTPSGYTAGCSDCHLKYGNEHNVGGFQYIGMLANKMTSASKSAFGQVAGHLSTFDKQKERAPEMGKSVVEWMSSTGFQNCRTCHDLSKMKNEKNPDVAAFHAVFKDDKSANCVECHTTAGHDYKNINTQEDANAIIAGKPAPSAAPAPEAVASEEAASAAAAQ